MAFSLSRSGTAMEILQLLISSIVGWLLGSSSSHRWDPPGEHWFGNQLRLGGGPWKFSIGLMQTLVPLSLMARGHIEVAAKEVFFCWISNVHHSGPRHFCLLWMIGPSTACLLWNSMVWGVGPTVHSLLNQGQCWIQIKSFLICSGCGQITPQLTVGSRGEFIPARNKLII